MDFACDRQEMMLTKGDKGNVTHNDRRFAILRGKAGFEMIARILIKSAKEFQPCFGNTFRGVSEAFTIWIFAKRKQHFFDSFLHTLLGVFR
ncbi:hypothetical protein RF55_14943 [Lasius niger]|uniref:Uncharacterized protein n=1 Tax=Lasius niger TaxID=67767 RepID=A0A0J7K7K0_LASNI|nr:hypothetical protein RF55_14943 [Lasius niger]